MERNCENGMGIYKIYNLVDGKVYIGSAVNFYKRYNRHISCLRLNKHYNSHLQNAWNKYGGDNFIFEIIENILDKNILLEKETYYIAFYNSSDQRFGYNQREVSDSNKGLKHTDEAKKKMSEAHKRENLSVETRNRYAEVARNRIFSEERNRKISESNKGKKMTKEAGDKITNSKLGKKKNGKYTSVYVGVSLNSNENRWAVYISFNKKSIYLGKFDTEIEAALAYNAKAIELYGENAKLNIIEEEDNE